MTASNEVRAATPVDAIADTVMTASISRRGLTGPPRTLSLSFNAFTSSTLDRRGPTRLSIASYRRTASGASHAYTGVRLDTVARSRS